jgi:hypothetical protein
VVLLELLELKVSRVIIHTMVVPVLQALQVLQAQDFQADLALLVLLENLTVVLTVVLIRVRFGVMKSL